MKHVLADQAFYERNDHYRTQHFLMGPIMVAMTSSQKPNSPNSPYSPKFPSEVIYPFLNPSFFSLLKLFFVKRPKSIFLLLTLNSYSILLRKFINCLPRTHNKFRLNMVFAILAYISFCVGYIVTKTDNRSFLHFRCPLSGHFEMLFGSLNSHFIEC